MHSVAYRCVSTRSKSASILKVKGSNETAETTFLPSTSTTREEFGVTYLDTFATPKRLIPTRGWGEVFLLQFRKPLGNSLLNP
ncbi:hypothetical protein CEXT_34591 [Caerostris extrusa]|uniref:Uncharacterized protein n=1 Tax=Caerostris extrusa TaxID=172846 RepID=A0AAV4XDW0_CAEEX|nr:hypothetical protein CEXT_34591 [Caerostris extrusa]